MKTKYVIPSHVKNALAALARVSPALPVKGRGHDRYRFPLLSNPIARQLWEMVPNGHGYANMYGRVSRYVSAEVHFAAKPVLDEIRKAEAEKWEKQLGIGATASLPVSRTRREMPVRVNEENLAKSKLTPLEVADFTRLISGAMHPFTGRALELKEKSGLSWGQIQA